MARPRGPDPRSVFLNVPYDAGYEPILLALLAALLALGRKPRATLEVEDRGEARPRRILQVLESTAVSFHDLSRAAGPARFNMPFELGLAFSFAVRTRRHRLYVLEAERGRLEETLSDLKGTEAYVHQGRPELAASCVLDVLGSARRDPSPREVRLLADALGRVAAELKKAYGRDTVFFPAPFRQLLAAGTELAYRAGFIPA
jgi:hypothetical protein